MRFQAEAVVILYKTASAKCGQATLCEKRASNAWSFAGQSEDICAGQGYTVLAEDQLLNVPGVCSIKVQLSAKAAMGSQAEADVVLYKITCARCGQATLGEKYTSAAKSFAGSFGGSCAAKGDTLPAGQKTLKVLIIGSIKVEVFAKAASVFQAEAVRTLYMPAPSAVRRVLCGREVRLGCVVPHWSVGGHVRRSGLHRARRRPGAKRAGHRS